MKAHQMLSQYLYLFLRYWHFKFCTKTGVGYSNLAFCINGTQKSAWYFDCCFLPFNPMDRKTGDIPF
jgi:hypothetical protein